MCSQSDSSRRLETAKALASRLIHLHFSDGNPADAAAFFAPHFLWIGGEDSPLPRTVETETYDAAEPSPGTIVVTGRLGLSPLPGGSQPVGHCATLIFHETPRGLCCSHVHCSPLPQETEPLLRERLATLELQAAQRDRQLDVILSTIPGGLKISRDDATYSYAYVSEEAAALFGYTVEEFFSASQGGAVGAVYPPDLDQALADCAKAFENGGLAYSTRYRVRCKDGSLKWIVDSGKKALNAQGEWMVNSLYLDVNQAEADAQRLREQSQLLSSIHDTVPCGIVRFIRRFDGTYELISMNQAALSLLDYPSLEVALASWRNGVLSTVFEDDQVALRQCCSLLHAVGDRQDQEYQVRRQDGSVTWLECSNILVDWTIDGEAVIQRTLMNITPRKLLQQQLDWEQELYRVAMEVSSDIMFEYLLEEDTFISYKPHAGPGVLRQEIPRYSQVLSGSGIVPPEDVAWVLDYLRSDGENSFELRLVPAGGDAGDYRWYRVNSRLIRRKGQPTRAVGTLRNIHSMKATLSKRSEQLRRNQSALQVISGVYLTIFYVDLSRDQYDAVRLPEDWEALSFPRSGRFSTEMCQRLLPYVAADDRARIASLCDREQLLKRLSQPGGYTEAEFHRTASNTLEAAWMRLEIHPVSGEDGRAVSAIVTLRNVSLEKQRELERQAEEAAAKQALEEAYEGARRADIAKSQFLSRMSHDIRTPMNAILGMASIAGSHLDEPDRLSDCLEKIHVSGKHLLGLINDMLDMSKIESGSVRLSEGSFLLSDMLRAVAQMIRTDATAKGQRLTLRTAIQSDAVRGDVMRIQQVLLNLLSNAVKYTGEGGSITLSVTQKPSDHSGVGCFEFTVEDNGIGISQAFQEKLFSPFERAADPRVSRVQGTGLGLSITHNLVQMMDGTIQVDSAPDRGTRFLVTLFLQLAEQAPTAVPSDAVSVPFAPGTTLLLAEDNALNQEIARELLQMSGLEVVCVSDGQEALDAFSQSPPGTYGLILMDIQMPVLDGYEATKAIRRLGETGLRPDAATIPILALTANAFADDAYRARQSGMNEHVAKPLELERLLSTLHRWLDTP